MRHCHPVASETAADETKRSNEKTNMSTKITIENITQQIASSIMRDALDGRRGFGPIGSETDSVNQLGSEAGGNLIIRANNDNECAVYAREDGRLVIVADCNGPVCVVI